MADNEKLDSDKQELQLSLDSFNEPTRLSGKKAWVTLVTNLLFIRKGTYPSAPGLGVGIQTYDFTFMDNAIETLQAEITDQTRTYLPDVPINSIEVDVSETKQGKRVLLIIISIVDDGEFDNAVIAALMSNNIIDFEVSM